MKKSVIALTISILLFMAFKDPAQKSFSKVLTNDIYNYISINNILMYISNNGDGSHDPLTDGNGFYWQEGSAIFEDGLLWGGKIEVALPDTQNIRINGNTHRQGLQAGKILENGLADDPGNPKYRVYKIRKDWQSLPYGSVKDQYQRDYDEWPVDDGAPWIDYDGDKIYTPYTDQPEFIGDEVLWYVANDLDTNRSVFTYGSLPLGLEQQCTVWGLNHPTELGNVVFKKYRMINKGLYDIDSMYFSMWSDPDLGGAGDDFVGIDTTALMAYIYNYDDSDAIYNAPVPAFGYVLLQSALIKSGQLDSAFYNGFWQKGYSTVGISSFIPFEGFRTLQDAQYGNYRGTLELYNFMQGKTNFGDEIIDPTTGLVETILIAGDPVSGTGWYEGDGWPSGTNAGDRRMLMSHGPFQMARMDTQDVVYAFVIGRGQDHIDSISKIRRRAKISHAAFYNNFEYPQMPQPDLKVSTQDKQVVLHWNDRTEDFELTDPYIDEIESNDTTYNFEGYRVWQYKDIIGSDPQLLAVFDLDNDVDEIYDYETVHGVLSLIPKFRSPNQGIRRAFAIADDRYSGLPLNNGSAYYFGVTAYAYNPESGKRLLESEPDIIEVIPQRENINSTFNHNFEDLIYARQVSGDGHGQIMAQIVNPESIQTKSYRIIINGTENDTLSWTFLNTDVSDTLVFNETDFNLDTLGARNYDGFKLLVQNQGRDSLYTWRPRKFGIKSIWQVADQNGLLEKPVDVINGLSHDGLWSITSIKSFWADDIRYYINAPTSDALGYDNYEIRFTTEEQGSEYYLYGYTGSVNGPTTSDIKADNKVPFQIWNVGRDLQSAEDDVRLKVKIRDHFLEPELDSLAQSDSLWSRVSNGNWEPVYGYLEQDSSYHDNLPAVSGLDDPSEFFIHNVVIEGELPEPGTIIRIIPWRPLSAGDVFEFSTTAPDTTDYNKARLFLNRITVFPNPYFGSHYRNNQPGQGFVRFGNLPHKVTIRIYTIAGQLVNKMEKNDTSPWLDWDLKTLSDKKVPSGIYIAHIKMPKIGKKILKIALVQDN